MMSNELPSRPRKETIMQRRLRKMKGEEVSDVLDELFDEQENEQYDSPPLHMPFTYAPGPHASGGIGGGVLFLFLAILGIGAVLFLFSPIIAKWYDPFAMFKPSIPAFISSPTPTIRSSATVISRIRQLNRLETTSYTVEKVIEAGVEGNVLQNLLFGDRLLLIAHGNVVAGIDLSKMQDKDVMLSEDGKRVTVRLPSIEIFSVALDEKQTRIYDRQQGFLTATDKDLETEARRVARTEILKAACAGNILNSATADAQRAMEQLLNILDFEHIEVIVGPIPPCPQDVVNSGR